MENAEELIEWRGCIGHPDYEVSSRGGIRSTQRYEDGRRHSVPMPRSRAGARIASLQVHRRGTAGRESVPVAQLVLMAFGVTGYGPDKIALHRNGRASDSSLVNLQWATYDQTKHFYATHHPDTFTAMWPLEDPDVWANKGEGEAKVIVPVGEPVKKLSEDQVRYIRAETEAGTSTAKKLSEELGVSAALIYNVRAGRSYKSVSAEGDVWSPEVAA